KKRRSRWDVALFCCRGFGCAGKRKRRCASGATPFDLPETRSYLILVSLNSTCFLTTGSYFVLVIFSVIVRLFFVVTSKKPVSAVDSSLILMVVALAMVVLPL